jgi:hypothetical protein
MTNSFCSLSQQLHDGWQFQDARDGAWHAAQVPGCVHTDLHRHELIPDPFWGQNERKLQWIEECDWNYRLQFDVAPELLQRDQSNWSPMGWTHWQRLRSTASSWRTRPTCSWPTASMSKALCKRASTLWKFALPARCLTSASGSVFMTAWNRTTLLKVARTFAKSSAHLAGIGGHVSPHREFTKR